MLADEIREFVFKRFIEPARKQSKKTVVIRAGDIHNNKWSEKMTDEKVISLKKVSETLYVPISFQTVLDVLMIQNRIQRF